MKENLYTAAGTASVREIGDMAFFNAKEAGSLKLREGLETIGEYAFCKYMGSIPLYNAHGRRYSKLTSVALPSTVRSLGQYAFGGSDAMTSFRFAQDSGPAEIPAGCFAACTALREIKIPGCVEAIGDEAFDYCTALSRADIGQGVKKLGKDVFLDCEKLASLQLPASIEEIGPGLLRDAGTKQLTVTAAGGSRAEEYMREKYPGVKLKVK